MLWDAPLIERLLLLYRDNPVLWDQKHHHYSEKAIKQMALQGIQEELGVPVSSNDIHRKYKTMRAAYQVEVRNINAAKLRGFYYKPSLHWFDIFHKFMEDTKEIKAQDKLKIKELLGGPTNPNAARNSYRGAADTKKFMIIQDGETPTRKKQVVEPIQEELQNEDSRDSSMAECSSDESEDEFQTFADHIAEQLRSMSVHRAVMIQNQIQRLFARDREMNDEEFVML